jgi:hypothetical protein
MIDTTIRIGTEVDGIVVKAKADLVINPNFPCPIQVVTIQK